MQPAEVISSIMAKLEMAKKKFANEYFLPFQNWP